jgi:hypothetical protein
LARRSSSSGLFEAIAGATFGDVSRREDEGRGIEGIIATDEGYFNPVVELMRDPAVADNPAVADEASYA